MFLSVECYEWDWDEDDWVLTEMKINPAHVVTVSPDDTIGDYCYVTFVNGMEVIIAMTDNDFEKVCAYAQIRTLLS